ncbi:pyridoxamine 5'-phosphate oxidase family protein [Salinirubrum litoreum]|uniref:Pyridoxamine 5'-phosphate oxidase family protein n=1 Tax=Salinirubrum litoreum TaxID=1126234 RepID=A0ABD5R8Z6_9EURY|nr:pyridoxamine 5'-phosphate oxidase family protein [Salinirubrum litoreum]
MTREAGETAEESGRPEFTGAWDRESVADFLAEHAIPVRLACRRPSGDLWMLSLWFEYDAEAGTLHCATKADADVVRFLRADAGVAFEISTNRPPYRGVRGAGTATLAPDAEKTRLRSLLDRYLGGTDSDLAEQLLRPEREEVEITIRPTSVYSWDFSERMASEDSDESEE